MPLIRIIAGIVALIFSFVCYKAGDDFSVKASDMKNWAQVPATLQRVSIQTDTEEVKTGARENNSNRFNSRIEHYYEVEVTYSYRYSGKTYTSTKLELVRTRQKTQARANEIADKLKPYRESGRTITCYVNPNNPAEAYLFPGATKGIVVGYAVSLVLAIGGIYAILSALGGSG
jgi:hypothetical protein